jgi:hypothetical protein
MRGQMVVWDGEGGGYVSVWGGGWMGRSVEGRIHVSVWS